MRSLRSAVLLSALLPLVNARAQAPSTPEDWGKLAASAKFTLVEAIERGQQAAKGTVFHVELELDAGKLVYSIDAARKHRVVNVVLDARDGKEIERGEDAEDHQPLVLACKTSLASAIMAASQYVSGPVLEAQMLLENGKPVVVVTVWHAARREVRVDGVTGAVLEAAPGSQSAPSTAAATEGPRFTDRFDVPAADLQAHGRNPFFVLEPGHRLVLEGKEGNDALELIITVLAETRQVAGVTCAIVEERESKGSKLVEISRNYFALGKRTNDVYYFGEDVDIYTDGVVTSHEGAWLAGEKGARFGLVMPGTPLLGARYHQEVAPGVAMDRAEVISLDEVFVAPAGRFERVLKTEETSTLEKGRGYKFYAAGVGLLSDGEVKLVRIGK